MHADPREKRSTAGPSARCCWCKPGALCPVHAPDLAVEVGGHVYLLLSEVVALISEVRAATRLELAACPGCAGPIGEFRRRVATAVAAYQELTRRPGQPPGPLRAGH